MTPNECGASRNNLKYFKGRIRAATILQAMTISSRTHLPGYHIIKMKLTMILIQGEISPLFLRMIPMTGKLYGD